MRLSVFVALVAAALVTALAATAPSGGRPGAPAPVRGPLLGVLDAHDELELARLDPATLRVRGAARLAVGTPGCAPRSGGEMCSSIPPWSFSPGGTRVAIARNERHSARALRIVHVERLRPVADVRLTGGPVGLVAWLARRRLLVVQEICCQERQSAAWIDAASGRVLARRLIGGSVLRAARTPAALVSLIATPNAIAPARLEVAGADGTMRVVTLDRVRAGVQLVDPAAHRVKQHVPGLTVDWPGRRAFVVAPGLVAEVDLRSLRVSYHELGRDTSLLDRLRDWIDPAAEAKPSSGPVRAAIWLDTGSLAVSGAGLSLVDARRWTSRTVDAEATDVRLAGDLLLASGGKRGLTAYGLDGHERFRLFDGQTVYVAQVYAGRAYVGAAGADVLRVVDLATGRTVGEHALDMPWLVADTPASWWK